MHLEETEINGIKVLSQIQRLFRIIKLYHTRRGLVIVMIEQCSTNWSSVYFCSNITKAGWTPMIEQRNTKCRLRIIKLYHARIGLVIVMIEQCSTNRSSV